MGYRPNVELAKNAGSNINEKGFIVVDEYMRTSETDIFAVGDCAGKRDSIYTIYQLLDHLGAQLEFIRRILGNLLTGLQVLLKRPL